MEIKFGNIVLEILIEHADQIFSNSTINGETKDIVNSKNSMKNNSSSHGTIHNDSHAEPVAPQRRAKRETVYVMDTGRPPGGRNEHSSSRSHSSSFSVSPRAESMYLDNSSSAQRVMVVQPSYVQRQSYHSLMSSSVQGHSSMTTSSSQKSYSSSTTLTNAQQSSSRNQHAASNANANSSQQTRNAAAPQRSTRKPLVVYNPSWNDHNTSSSSSSESLNSPRNSSGNTSHHMLTHTSPSSLKSSSSHHQPLSHGSPPVRTSSSHHQLATHSTTPPTSHHHTPSNQSIKTSPSLHRRMDKSYSPAHSPNRTGSRSAEGHRSGTVVMGAEKPRRSSRAMLDVVGHQRHGSAGSRDYLLSGVRLKYPSTSSSSSSSSVPSGNGRRVRTLYACVGENDSELSFEPNQIIYNVRQSREPGWLEGCLNGRTGLIPENYVECLP
ncbi:rho GTPase-activating protein 26 [Caerostris extrusa]|uniref:Rho GTPase-activating protein 26 n=1 Tax=Caerostris extrusa TaxID=172846 RepID=A0AAV4Q887_CAEEX|nr:rho GTPase-activating protein 26 [Caerostris extrusa]